MKTWPNCCCCCYWSQARIPALGPLSHLMLHTTGLLIHRRLRCLLWQVLHSIEGLQISIIWLLPASVLFAAFMEYFSQKEYFWQRPDCDSSSTSSSKSSQESLHFQVQGLCISIEISFWGMQSYSIVLETSRSREIGHWHSYQEKSFADSQLFNASSLDLL